MPWLFPQEKAQNVGDVNHNPTNWNVNDDNGNNIDNPDLTDTRVVCVP